MCLRAVRDGVPIEALIHDRHREKGGFWRGAQNASRVLGRTDPQIDWDPGHPRAEAVPAPSEALRASQVARLYCSASAEAPP